MAINKYFSNAVRSEQDLIESLSIEAIGIKGMDVYYVQRNLLTRDMLLNEAVESVFDKTGLIEMYLENIQGYEGQGFMFSKFGLEIRDQATFVVSKRRWSAVSSTWQSMPRPKEGDLIYVPLTKSFFEIKFVDARSPFYQLSKVPVYKLQCELFEHSDELITTGVTEIDQLQNSLMSEFTMDLAGSNGIDPVQGETITQMVGAIQVTGKVLSFSNNKLSVGTVGNDTGAMINFAVTAGSVGKIVGSTSGAQWNVSKVYDIADPTTDETFPPADAQAQNREIELEGDSIIDTSEKNRFGDPTQV